MGRRTQARRRTALDESELGPVPQPVVVVFYQVWPFEQRVAVAASGLGHSPTGDYPAAAASQRQALTLFRDLGDLLGQAEALNRLGELATRTSAAGNAREEARALEGLGHSHLRDGDPSQAAAHLRHALTIYQRIGAPAALRVQKTLGT
jgi:tetratricopeptide (TPR) repeat protein